MSIVRRLPVAHLPNGGHGGSLGIALGCRCRACQVALTREVLTAANWDAQ